MRGWITTAPEFRAWKRRRGFTNAEIARLTGLAAGTVSKKLNGRKISNRLPRELANIDRLISRGDLPADCPERVARRIIAGELR